MLKQLEEVKNKLKRILDNVKSIDNSSSSNSVILCAEVAPGEQWKELSDGHHSTK